MGTRAVARYAALAAIASLALSAASAQAAERFAQPGASGAEPCARADPCALNWAINGHSVGDVQPGDVVRLLPGDYVLPSGLTIGQPVVVRADDPADPPVLQAGGSVSVLAPGAAIVRDLVIEHSGTAPGLRLINDHVGERLLVRSTAPVACRLEHSSLLRSSVCLNLNASGVALSVFSGSATVFPRAVNVTAIAPNGDLSAGIFAAQTTANGQLRFEGTNTIASGAVDIVASETGGGTARATVVMRNSNYDSTQTSGTAFVEDAGGNQDAPPLFRNLAAEDFRPRAGSPTRDAGTMDAELGLLDLQRIARVQGKRVDIGAYEFDAAPETRITRRPGGVLRVIGRAGLATFRFKSSEVMSTFECRLRGGKRAQRRWRACDSPRSYAVRVRKRKYVFQVRATDASGKRDTRPAKARFRVRSR